MGGKWLQLLKELAPNLKRAAILFNPDTAAGGGTNYLPSFEAAARSLTVEAIAAPVHNEAEVEAVITSVAREFGGGLVLMADAFNTVHYPSIILLAARNKIPALSWSSNFVRDGGLISYGPDFRDLYRRAAPYVDRILRGTKPADLPVQLPVKFEMAVNLKTAKMLGLTVPQSILLRADEVIE